MRYSFRMRRSTKNAPPPVVVKITKTCTREGCVKALTPSQKRYCSQQCRNIVLKGGNGGGGKTTYRSEYSGKKFEEYLTQIEEENRPSMIPTKGGYIVLQNARIPTLEDYAEWLGIKDATFEHWAGQFAPFAITLDRLKRIQKTYLLNNGLSGRYNPQLSKLALGTNHGMVERKEIDNRHKLLGVVKHVYDLADQMEREERDALP